MVSSLTGGSRGGTQDGTGAGPRTTSGVIGPTANDRRPFVAQKFSPLLTAKVHTVALRVITSSRDYRIAPPQLEPPPAVQPKQ